MILFSKTFRQLSLGLIALLIMASCGGPGQSKKEASTTPDEPAVVSRDPGAATIASNPYPEALQRVFDAHGGLDAWKAKRTLRYVIPGDLPETHTIDLWTREDRVDTDAYSMGFDGERTWILDPDNAYEGNPEFYHNLMFYFYAMPFVLADPGIVYGDTPDLEYQGKRYPGVSISYNAGVGISPKDEYYLHYDPETGQMAWLGYTVTYRTGEDSDNVKWIRYDDWGRFGGVVLPETISWYEYEGRDIGELRNTVEFADIRVSELQTDPVFFSKPADGTYFTRAE
ncbi:DUF6503 family protein [Robiginitalea sp. SC105]|uniref:DUF6503 family protein n=1 Tax=Robiginitalea sp. SC105 TaxID=2762332 RepID=UPI00163975E4|nr:DUF6503 family protein [Robiginitalea sp. SC105]MBC2838820.1 hypothetical protein [Robiginitalea sp. SC105]